MPSSEWGAGQAATTKRQALTVQLATPMPTFYCPSRRPPATSYGGAEEIRNANLPPGNLFAKTDYAANGGSHFAFEEGPPLDCLTKYPNCNFGGYIKAIIAQNFNGVIVPRFSVKLRQIEDGTSNTLLIAEKYVNSQFYDAEIGYKINSCSDNNPVFNGYDWDNVRWTKTAQPMNGNEYTPTKDNAATDLGCSTRFGSAHDAVFYAAMCDGSVRGISYDVDRGEFQLMGMRSDGGAIPK